MRSHAKSAKPLTLAQPYDLYTTEPKSTWQQRENHSQTSAVGEHYERHQSTEDPQLHLRIVRAMEKHERRLRIEEAMAIRTANPMMNRRGEDTVSEFLI